MAPYFSARPPRDCCQYARRQVRHQVEYIYKSGVSLNVPTLLQKKIAELTFRELSTMPVLYTNHILQRVLIDESKAGIAAYVAWIDFETRGCQLGLHRYHRQNIGCIVPF